MNVHKLSGKCSVGGFVATVLLTVFLLMVGISLQTMRLRNMEAARHKRVRAIAEGVVIELKAARARAEELNEHGVREVAERVAENTDASLDDIEQAILLIRQDKNGNILIDGCEDGYIGGRSG